VRCSSALSFFSLSYDHLLVSLHRIKNLSDPAHRFKVRKNAEQLNLTGVVIFNPHFGFVYVEGAPRFMRNYKRLMLQRIAWTEAARPRGAEDVEVEERGDDEGVGKDKEKAEGNEGEEQANLEDNRCDLVWEGQLRERAFNGFKPRSCPTDGLAKEVLGPKLAGYWDSAKNFKPAEDEFF
jgi:U4/U6 small nuclear ribonucleoprotein PRP3